MSGSEQLSLQEKLAYWRENGMQVCIPHEWGTRDPIWVQERQAIEDAESTGRDFERV